MNTKKLDIEPAENCREDESAALPEAGAFRSGFVAIAGPANAGKSTLLNRLVGYKVSIVSPKQQTTRTRILAVRNSAVSQIVFVDTPGFLASKHKGELSRFIARSISQGISDCDTSMLVVDGSKLHADPALLVRLRASLRERKLSRPSVVAINKIDLLADRKPLLPLIKALSDLFTELAGGEDLNAPGPNFVPVSAKTGEGIEQLAAVLESKLPEGEPYFPATVFTDQQDETFAAEIVREQLFRQLNQELPYSTAVRIENWEEQPELLKISAVILVERPAQKKIVIGSGGAKLKSIGTAARVELERAFGTKVFLELFVKVEADWTKTHRGLERAGYRGGN